MGKLFGTDGIRGVVNKDYGAVLAYRVGVAAATVLAEEKKRPLFTIGKDTRLSSDLLEAALIAGICSAGADVIRLGVIPTPAVAFLTVDEKADAGIVISASHNPFEHNGIKIFNGSGFKLSDDLEEKIEEMVLSRERLPVCSGSEIGRVLVPEEDLTDRYIRHLISTIDPAELKGLRLAVDCANGAASATAARLFGALPVQADIFCDKPDGVNINTGCGSTHLENLKAIMAKGEYDLGLAFDGDADRCLAVDETGAEMDGDHIMAACALLLRQEGRLPGDTIVATVMSNMGFHTFAKEQGLQLLCAKVGDRNVLEQMRKGGYALGGEQSGHLIFLDHATTGDGQLAALQLLRTICRTGKKASGLNAMVAQFPQELLNVPVASNEAKLRIMDDPALKAAAESVQAELEGCGRLLVRPSGTEALIRVMVEAPEKETAEKYAKRIAEVVSGIQ
ncbi:MAG: phosphoglucosamine mutase [Oscillospiraceae bacterium]|nr:phosphoglucosamine mutase [Oscillospiraceae bacterium]